MATTGRKSKLTPAIQAIIVESVKAGNYIETAGAAAGLPKQTVYAWLRKGRDPNVGDEAYVDFYDAVTRAQAEAEQDLVATVRAGDDRGVSNGPSKSAQWLLERTRPKRFAQRINLRVEEELEELLNVIERVCSPEDFERVLEALAARDSGEEAPGEEEEAETDAG